VRRAIVVFVEDKRELLLQLGGLFTSLRHIRCDDTDLVVFGPEAALQKIPGECVRVACEPYSSRPEWKGYPFINSLSCLVGEEAGFLDGYDLILRSDVDVFLSPGWNTFRPRHYSVGKGRFVNDGETKRNLKRIASRFGLTHKGIHDVGSTHYGPAPLVRDVCRLSVKLASWILTEEFAASEGRWPGWYRGVTSLYASEIAVNHLVRRFDVLPGKLDFPSTSSRNPGRHPHIHCWHTRRTFSKFEFAEGRYDDVDPDSLDLKKTRDYCLYMSLRSKRDLPGLG
jgi:hypothetical protein